MFIHAFEQACLFLPLVLAVYLSYRILRITDLTTEGSFVLGAVLFALCVDAKQSVYVAMLIAMCGGVLSGSMTSLLQRILGFSDLIAGILSVFILYSVCLKSMGRPNMSLYDKPSLVSIVAGNGALFQESYAKVIVALLMSLLLYFFLYKLLNSQLGLTLRAFGNNSKLLELFGKNEKIYCLIGLVISNVFAAIGGAVTAQFQGFTDIGMGAGVVLIALSAVIIGQRLSPLLFGRFAPRIPFQLLGCFFGIFFYFLIIHALLKIGIDPMNLKMATAVLVVVILSLNRKQFRSSQ